MLRHLDWPPVWTLGFLVISVALARYAPIPVLDLLFSGALLRPLGVLIAAVALVLALWAALTMTIARTTFIPHRNPSALVAQGPFRVSRNPIYLADLGFLLAAGFYTGSLWPVLAIPALATMLTRRFIEPEEAALRATFPDEWRTWSADVRRWL